MIRTGYDADTRQYTFHDNTTGVQFISAPGERYGTLLPAATANYVKPKRGANRRLTRTYFLYTKSIRPFPRAKTVQAYDRPVLFEGDLARESKSSPSRGHKSAPSSPASRSPTSSSEHSGSTRRHAHGHGHAQRSATFADILPAHLIDRAASSPVEPKRAPRPQPLSKSPVVDEKGHRNWPHVTSSEKTVQPVSRQYLGDKGGGGPRDALRSTVRMLGRSLTTVRRTRSHERQRDHDGYVLV
ncbi:hypothetical protein EDB85DRAFT_593076 [Lactarius pseudohatsudake]|nr:hypothetical protein EDB85DRAFT_593076 [Lactarius pseudohatsudake]